MTKLCPRGKAAAKRKFKVYPSAYANAYASKICAGKIKDPSGVKRKDFRGSKAEGGLMEATARLKRQGLEGGGISRISQRVKGMTEFDKKMERRKTFLLDEKRDKDKKKTQKKDQEAGIPMMARGGRAGFKSGMRVCKLAKRGKGRAYGKNT